MHWWHHCLATQSCSSGLCSLIFKFSEGQSGKYPKDYLSIPVPWTLMIDFNFNVRLPCADFSLISTWKCSWVEAFSVWCNSCIGLWLPQEPCVHHPRYGEVAPPWIGSSSQCSECIEGWGKPSSELFLSTSTPPPLLQAAYVFKGNWQKNLELTFFWWPICWHTIFFRTS